MNIKTYIFRYFLQQDLFLLTRVPRDEHLFIPGGLFPPADWLGLSKS